MKKSAYINAGGWNEKVGAFDDWDLAKRLRVCNLKIGRCTNNYILHDEGHLTLRSLFLKKYRMGENSRLGKTYLRSKFECNKLPTHTS